MTYTFISPTDFNPEEQYWVFYVMQSGNPAPLMLTYTTMTAAKEARKQLLATNESYSIQSMKLFKAIAESIAAPDRPRITQPYRETEPPVP